MSNNGSLNGRRRVVITGLVKRIDRSVKAVSVNSIEALERLPELLSDA